MASAAEGSGMSRISLTRNAASDHTITEGAGIGRIMHHKALSAIGALTARLTTFAMGYDGTARAGTATEKETLNTGGAGRCTRA